MQIYIVIITNIEHDIHCEMGLDDEDWIEIELFADLNDLHVTRRQFYWKFYIFSIHQISLILLLQDLEKVSEIFFICF